MPISQTPALVLPVGHPRSVALVRSLARAGVPVWAADTRAYSHGLVSRWPVRRYRVPAEPEAVLDVLEDLGRERRGVLFPTTDALVRAVSRQHDRMAKFWTPTVPPWEVLGRLMERRRAYVLASELGIRTTEHHAPRDARELEALLPQLDFEHHGWLFKTDVWDVCSDPEAGRFTKVVSSPEELRRCWCDVASRAETPPLIERVVPATSDMCIGVSLVVNAAQEPVVAYAVRRLRLETYAGGPGFRHPYALGSNVFCETVHDPEALEASLALARASEYQGTITFEFRRDATDGALTFVKADPRQVRATALSGRIGMDVPRAQYALAVGEAPPEVRDYADGVGWIWITKYVRALREVERGSEARQELVRLVRRLPRLRAFAYWSLRDPKPFLSSLTVLASRPRRRRATAWLARRAARRAPLIDLRGS